MTPEGRVTVGPPTRLPARTLWLAASLYFSVFAAVALWVWQRWGGELWTQAALDIASVTGVVFAAGCAASAGRSARGRIRTAWLAMAGGLAGRAVGEVIWTCHELGVGYADVRYPSWPDGFYLLYPLGAGVAVTLMATANNGRPRIRLILDSVIVAGSLFLLVWVGVIHAVVRAHSGARLTGAVFLAYPVADVVISTIAWASAVVAYRASMGLLLAGLVMVSLSDSAFTALTAANSEGLDNLGDLGWFAGCGLLGLAALRSVGERPREEIRAVTPLRARLWLPYLPLLAASVVALAQILPSVHSVPLRAAVLILVVAVLARQWVALAENRRVLSDVGRLAFTDQLTSLANRALFLDRAGQAVLRQRREPITLTVLCVDLDGFKAVNDELGHSAGDDLLIRVAERLSVAVRDTDTVARLGGDEFAILIEGPLENTPAVADRILDGFVEPIIVDGVALKVQPSIGLTFATADMSHTSVESLLRQADLAMYAAKRDGGGCLRSFVPDLPNPYELPWQSRAVIDARAANDVDETALDSADDLTTQHLETAAAQSRRPPPNVQLALAGIAAGWAVFALLCLLRTRPGPTVEIKWLGSALFLGSAAVVAQRSWRVGTERWAWGFIAAGMASAAIAVVSYAIWVPEVHFPSVADLLTFAFYPLVLTGLLLMVRQRLHHLPLAIRLDVVIVGQTVGAVATALALGPFKLATTGSRAGTLLGLAYAVGSLLLLALSAGSLAMFGWRTGGRWALLVAGFVLSVFASVVYAYQVAHGLYARGSWVDVCWPGACLLIALAAWVPDTHSGARLKTGRAPAHLSIVSAVLAFGVVGLANGHLVPVVLAAGTLTAIAARIVVTFRDVSALAESHHYAMTDEVTGLPNRLAVATALTAATYDEPTASWWDRRGAKLSIVLLALDQFQDIAASLGRSVSSELLYNIGERLTGSVPPTELVARVSEDQFAVLLRQTDLTTTRAQAGQLMDILRAPFALDHITVQVEASLGIALWPDHCAQPQDLLRCAESATAHAKASSSHIAVYNAAADPDVNYDSQLIADLRDTLTLPERLPDVGELTCYYQPKIRSEDDSVHSVEALVRWHHPERGVLLPDQFLPAAEDAGLMRLVAGQVLDIALGQIRSWREQGVTLRVAVNLSTTNLLDLGLGATIASLLRKHDLPADTLIVEITESTLTTDSDRARGAVAALRRLGVCLSLDDYGTGWSSLARLQDLSVDELKLDRVFVARLARDPRTIAIVRSTVALAHSLGADLVAEGVEDTSTLFALRQYGCAITQGHVHCPALLADEFVQWLATRSPTSSGAGCQGRTQSEQLVSPDSTDQSQPRLPN